MYLRPRAVNAMSALASNTNEIPCEADFHADTTCLGRGALKILDFNTPVRVQGYDPALGAREYQTISGGVVYVHPHTKVLYHLIFHQAIHMPHLDHHLLYPMQLRAHGVDVNDCPRIYCKSPGDESHAIVAKDEYGDEIILPFYLKGVISHFNTEPLSREEFE